MRPVGLPLAHLTLSWANRSCFRPVRWPSRGRLTPLQNEPFRFPGSSQRAALLIHGLGGGPYELQRLGEHLASRGITAQGLRLPGHAPARRMPASSWLEWSRAVDAAHDELAQRFEQVDLMGFSTGAMLALHRAVRCAHRGRLVLLAPFVRVFRPPLLPFRPEALLGALPFVRVVPRRRPPLRDRQRRREVEACAPFHTFSLEATRSALELIGAVFGSLHEVKATTLIVQGRRDTVVDASGAAELQARLPGSRLSWMERSDHLLTLDVEAAEVLSTVAGFL